MLTFRKYGDLLAATGAALVAALSSLTQSGGIARVGLSLLLVLVLPGYVAAAALFPANTLQRVERLVASLGLSLAIAILGGIALNLTPWGLQTSTWAPLLAGVTVCMGGIAVVRRYSRERRDAAKRSASPRLYGLPRLSPAAPSYWSGRLAVPQALMLGAALLITVGAVAITARGQLQHDIAQDATATQLWIQPATQGGAPAIQLGMTNWRTGVTQYQINLTSKDVTVRQWNITLRPGATWQTTVVLSPAEISAGSIQAVLFRASDMSTPYRQVTLRLQSAGKSGARLPGHTLTTRLPDATAHVT